MSLWGLFTCLLNLLLLIYPAYKTFKVLKSDCLEEYKFLLYYWIIAAAYLFLQDWADIILFWIPFYKEIKFIFVILITQTQFSQFLYLSYLQPYLRLHEIDIDNKLELFRGLMKSMALSIGFKLYTSIKQTLLNFVHKNNTMTLPNIALLTTVMANSSLEDSLFRRNDPNQFGVSFIKERLDLKEDKIDPIENERLKRERLEKERIEQLERNEYLEKARFEIERLEREKLEREKLEKERKDKETEKEISLERERLENEKKLKEIDYNINDRKDPNPIFLSKENLQIRKSIPKENKIYEITPVPLTRNSKLKLDSIRPSNIAGRVKKRRETQDH